MGTFSKLEEDMKELKQDMVNNVRRLDSMINKLDTIRTTFKYTPRERLEYLQNELNKVNKEIEKWEK